MTALIVVAIVLGYLAIAAAVARPVYGWMRAKMIDHNAKHFHSDPVSMFDDIDRGLVKTGAIFAALVWPLLPVLYAGGAGLRVYGGYLAKTPRLSQHELRIERERMRARIAELEREVGL